MNEQKKPQRAEDVPPSLLWAMYTKAPRPHELVDLPVGEKFPLTSLPQIAMVPLSMEEIMLSQRDADHFVRTKVMKAPPAASEENEAFKSLYENEVTVQVLCRACRDPSDPRLQKQVFPGPKAIREFLTLDQISILALEYKRVERLLSPIRSFMSKEEMDTFLLRLREGGRETPLEWLSSELLRDLLRHSVSNPPWSRTGSTSPGRQPDESESLRSDPEPEEPALPDPPDEPSLKIEE